MNDIYRLTFLLPDIMLLLVPEGRHCPCLAGCVLIVDRGVVTIVGPSREQLFDQVRRFFRAHARRLPLLKVAATLETPRTPASNRGGGRDGWTIVVNSEVTFTASAITDARPALRIVGEEEALAS